MVRALPRILLPLLALAALNAPPRETHAGLNAGATAQLYWQVGNGPASASNVTSSSTPQLLVTLKGLRSIWGADVQLLITGCTGAVPPAWQFQSGGCNDGYATFYVGGRGGTYPSAFSASPPVQGLIWSQNNEYFNAPNCLTPHGTAMLWLSAAGAGGQPRDPGVEYGIWAVYFDLTQTTCAGGPADPGGAAPIGIVPNYRAPCNDVLRGSVMAVLDADGVIDYVPFPMIPGGSLLWDISDFCACYPGFCDPVKTQSWGNLRRMYR